MSIKLTKKIGDKVVELDLISLDGKSVVRNNTVKELQKKGITVKDLEKAGFSVKNKPQPDESWLRKDLNNYAKNIGIKNPEKMANKDSVLEAIQDNL
jgi:hypothetical protein